MTRNQTVNLARAFERVGLGSHRPLALAVASKTIGRAIDSRNQLTKDEYDTLMEQLRSIAGNEQALSAFQVFAMAADPVQAFEDAFPGVFDDYAIAEAMGLPFAEQP